MPLRFGGIVSKAYALAALLRLTGKRGFGPRQMVSTGDVAAYCGQPAQCVAALRALGAASIRGNCEESLAAQGADCGGGFPPGSACDLLSIAWYAHAPADWVRGARLDGRRAALRRRPGAWPALGVVHGGATAISRYLWATSQGACFAEEIADFERLAGPVDAILAAPAARAPWRSGTIRTARSFTSGEYVLVAFLASMAPSSQKSEPPVTQGRFSIATQAA